jgi:hypothetical protein
MPVAKPCRREGCLGEVQANAVSNGMWHCSQLCAAVDRTLSLAQQRNVSGEVWSSLVAAADAVSEWRGVVTAEARAGRTRGQRRRVRHDSASPVPRTT